MQNAYDVVESIQAELESKLPSWVEIFLKERDDKPYPANFKPFVVLHWGSPIRTANDRGLCGSKNEAHWLVVSAVVYAADVEGSGSTIGLVQDILTDFKPNGAGRMTLSGGEGWTEKATTAVPKRFAESLSYRLLINL